MDEKNVDRAIKMYFVKKDEKDEMFRREVATQWLSGGCLMAQGYPAVSLGLIKDTFMKHGATPEEMKGIFGTRMNDKSELMHFLVSGNAVLCDNEMLLITGDLADTLKWLGGSWAKEDKYSRIKEAISNQWYSGEKKSIDGYPALSREELVLALKGLVKTDASVSMKIRQLVRDGVLSVSGEYFKINGVVTTGEND